MLKASLEKKQPSFNKLNHFIRNPRLVKRILVLLRGGGEVPDVCPAPPSFGHKAE